MLANGQTLLGAMLSPPVVFDSHRGHMLMTIVKLLGAKLSPLVDVQTRELKNRSQRVELLGTKPLTPVPRKKGQHAAGTAKVMYVPDQVVTVAQSVEVNTPMQMVTG